MYYPCETCEGTGSVIEDEIGLILASCPDCFGEKSSVPFIVAFGEGGMMMCCIGMYKGPYELVMYDRHIEAFPWE